MTFMRNKVMPLWLSALLACVLIAPVGEAGAQPYPSRPIKIVVPFGPGGSGDIMARTFSQFLEGQVKQPVIVENKPGANGIIGTEAVKSAPPDGYTLLLTTNTTHAANMSLYKKLPYDPLKDFDHIGLFGTFASVAVVPQGTGIQSIPDLVAFAKNNPGGVFFGHYNSASQMSAELFKARSGIPMTAVSYKTIGNAVADLMGKQIHVLFMEYVSGSSHIEGGKVVPLGVTGRERHKAWPGVPAIAEFYPGYELTAFLGLAAPARTPPDVVDALHRSLSQAIADPGVTQAFERLGMSSRAMTRDEYRRYISGEIERWALHVKAANIEPQ
jgi:tripartite-type tricarboxylate transporter receptor subunit TctC